MRLLVYRDYPLIDYQTMDEFIGHERLFRATDGGFLLHYVIGREARSGGTDHLADRAGHYSWLNEAPDEFGSFWECAMDAPIEEKQIQHTGQIS